MVITTEERKARTSHTVHTIIILINLQKAVMSDTYRTEGMQREIYDCTWIEYGL